MPPKFQMPTLQISVQDPEQDTAISTSLVGMSPTHPPSHPPCLNDWQHRTCSQHPPSCVPVVLQQSSSVRLNASGTLMCLTQHSYSPVVFGPEGMSRTGTTPSHYMVRVNPQTHVYQQTAVAWI